MRAIMAILTIGSMALAQESTGKRDDKGKAKELLDAAAAVMKDATAISVECDSKWKGEEMDQKLKLCLKRPNLARVEFLGAGQDGTLVIDGNTVWYYAKASNEFRKEAQTPGLFDIITGTGPIGTLFYEKSAGKYLDFVTDIIVKKERFNDDECDQIIWKSGDTVCRLWIDTKKALRQYEAKYKVEDEETTMRTVTFGALDCSPKLADDAFVFVPPKNAKEMQDGGDFDKNLLAVDSEAPDFEGTDLDGKAVKLSDFKGKVVLLNFWFHG